MCSVFLAGIFVSGYKIFHILKEYRAGEIAYEELYKYAPVIDEEGDEQYMGETEPESHKPESFEPQASEQKTQSNAPNKTNKPSSAPKTIGPPDFDALRAINSDIAAWIYMNGCNINYPVVRGENNDFYLNHLFNKKYNGAGCIFLDYRNDPGFTARNSVIYGHSMKNGSMFASLKKYKKQSFYDKYPVFHLFTPEGDQLVEIFSGYVAPSSDNAWKISFYDDDDFALWLNERIEKSMFRSSVSPSPEDRIITLSTCTYEFNDARFVLFGRIQQKE